MDENKTGKPRRRRASIDPRLEDLEGRRLMAVALNQVGIKEVALSGYNELNLTGTNKGDTIIISDNGTDSPGNITVTLGNGTTYTSQSAVSVIELKGGSKADTVAYNLTGPLTVARSVLLNLGGGNDTFTANIAGDVNTPNGLDLEVYGGSGNDTMTVDQAGQTLAGAFVPYLEGDSGNNIMTYNGSGNIAAGASVTPEFAGGSGNDTITSNYSGQIDGNYIYNLSTKGGSGKDTITNNINVGANSTGSIGTSASNPAAIEAGKGVDKMRFAIEVDPTSTALINAVAIGGSAKDTITHTANVEVEKFGSKNDTVIS